MKTFNKLLLSFAFLSVLSITILSCNEEDSIGPTQIDSNVELTDLDLWIRDNFIAPYNIEMQYEWDQNEVDLNRFLYPPTVENIRPLLEAVSEIWIEPYEEVGGEDFIKSIAPRQFTFVGGPNFTSDGNRLLGLAEQGTKITLFQVDQLDLKDINNTRRFFETIQHEYTHILNQTVPFDVAFGQITPESYTAQWFNVSRSEANELGFITDYSLASPTEDFAEMTSELLTNSKDEYEAIINNISSQEAVDNLRLKEQFVVNYFASEFGIDIYELQELTYQKTLEVINR